MPTSDIVYAFTSGELSPTLQGRTDLEKYDLGLSEAVNFFVDYRGGLTTRSGSLFVDYLPWGTKFKLFKFQFAPDETNNYLVIFAGDRIAFVQDGGFVLDDDITMVSNGTGNWTLASGKAINNYDVLKLVGGQGSYQYRDGYLYQLGTDKAYVVAGGTVQTFSPVYTIFHNYNENALDDLRVAQNGDLLRLTHSKYPIRNLTRYGHTNWTIEDEDFTPKIGSPTPTLGIGTRLGMSAGASEKCGTEYVCESNTYLWGVTAVDAEGNESSIGLAVTWPFNSDANNRPSDYSVQYYWNPVPRAVKYRVYRSNLHRNTVANYGARVGFIGEVTGTYLQETNGVPDFTRSPPKYRNPFAKGAIESITVVNTGSGYSNNSTLVPPPEGEGFLGYPVVSPLGQVGGVRIVYGGEGYIDKTSMGITGGTVVFPPFGRSSPAVLAEEEEASSDCTTHCGTKPIRDDYSSDEVFNKDLSAWTACCNQQTTVNNDGSNLNGAGNGTNAVLLVRTTPITGTYPSISAKFQQRQVYAATDNNPLTIYGSRVRRYSDFSESEIISESDAYELDIDSELQSPIKHLVTARGGLLAFTESHIWEITGQGNEAVTATTANANMHTYSGANDLPPLRINNDIVYTESKSASVRMLSFNEYAKIYSSEDISILSNHLFSLEKAMTSWCYSEAPSRMAWGVRKDGTVLGFTFNKEQKVFAWTRCETEGKYLAVESVQEGFNDSVYFVTERLVAGKLVRFIEQQALHIFHTPDDSVCLDAALQTRGDFPVGDITIHIDGKMARVVASSASMADYPIGTFIRAGGAVLKISDKLSDKEIICQYLRNIKEKLLNSNELRYSYNSGEWEVCKPFTTVTGLFHLEGNEVSVVADGFYKGEKKVINGSIEFDNPVTKVTVGFKYLCQAKTLPPTSSQTVIEDRLKSIVKVTANVYKTSSLLVGQTGQRLYPLDMLDDNRGEYNKALGAAQALISGITKVSVDGSWKLDTTITIRQEVPLPATVLNIIYNMDLGSDTN